MYIWTYLVYKNEKKKQCCNVFTTDNKYGYLDADVGYWEQCWLNSLTAAGRKDL